ncbi:MAG: M48 family metalloprotease [Alphaproteobacteria bacterium]
MLNIQQEIEKLRADTGHEVVLFDDHFHPNFRKIVQDLATKAGLTEPLLLVVLSDDDGAYVYTDFSMLAITMGELNHNSEAELALTVGHEIGHVLLPEKTTLVAGLFWSSLLTFIIGYCGIGLGGGGIKLANNILHTKPNSLIGVSSAIAALGLYGAACRASCSLEKECDSISAYITGKALTGARYYWDKALQNKKMAVALPWYNHYPSLMERGRNFDDIANNMDAEGKPIQLQKVPPALRKNSFWLRSIGIK